MTVSEKVEHKVKVSEKVEHQLNDVITNWTTSNSVSLKRLDGLQNEMTSVKSELKAALQRLDAVERSGTKAGGYTASDSR